MSLEPVSLLSLKSLHSKYKTGKYILRMVIRVVLVILSKMHSMRYQLSTQEILSITYARNGLEIYTPKKIFHFEDRKWQMWEQ